MGTAAKVTMIFLLTVAVSGFLWYSRQPPALTPARAADTGVRETGTLDLLQLDAEPDINPKLVAAFEYFERELAAQRREQEALRKSIAELNHTLLNIEVLDTKAESDTGVDAGKLIDAEAATRTATAAIPINRSRQRLTQNRLENAGFNSYEAEEILSTADRLAMERLNLQYEATREGWIRTNEYREALQEIPSIRTLVTDEYGDDGYDRYLYASGRSNRLVVNDVYRESPAAGAGLQAGDQVISMAGERIYTNSDLRQITNQGSAGETIPVVIERAGTRIEVYVPRGPLGVRVGRGYVNPGDDGG
jgi:hypothetical protein